MNFIKKHWFILLILVLFLWVFTWAYGTARTYAAWLLAAAAAAYATLQAVASPAGIASLGGALIIGIASYLVAGVMGWIGAQWYSLFGSPPGTPTTPAGSSLPSATILPPSTNNDNG